MKGYDPEVNRDNVLLKSMERISYPIFILVIIIFHIPAAGSIYTKNVTANTSSTNIERRPFSIPVVIYIKRNVAVVMIRKSKNILNDIDTFLKKLCQISSYIIKNNGKYVFAVTFFVYILPAAGIWNIIITSIKIG